jgi:hypothetical protein
MKGQFHIHAAAFIQKKQIWQSTTCSFHPQQGNFTSHEQQLSSIKGNIPASILVLEMSPKPQEEKLHWVTLNFSLIISIKKKVRLGFGAQGKRNGNKGITNTLALPIDKDVVHIYLLCP